MPTRAVGTRQVDGGFGDLDAAVDYYTRVLGLTLDKVIGEAPQPRKAEEPPGDVPGQHARERPDA